MSIPTVFPSPPRQVRPRPAGLSGRFASALYALLFMAALLSLAVVPIRWYVQSHGSPVQVTITDKYVSHSAKHGDSYHVNFNYSFEGKNLSDSQQVNWAEYEQAGQGDTAHGKAARILGINVCLTDIGDVNRETHTWMFVTGLWNLIAWVIFGVAAYKILQARRLVQEGTAVPGTVTNRRTTRGRSTYRYVAYQFTTTSGETLHHERNVSLAGFKSVDIGSAVTVLYDPANPGRSIVYECSNYIVEG